MFVVERAHRVPGGRPKPGAPPRPILAKLLNFRDRDVILQNARAAPPLRYQNAEISFFPDFPLNVQKQRRSFLEVKKKLHDKGVKYAMLFPAWLWVEAEGKAWSFDYPEAAADWLEGWRRAREHNAR